jgi:uncharacterized protein YndB with AHSA1/START domain
MTDVQIPEGTQQIDLVREFDAPVELVWRCYSEPELLKRWLGPRRLQTRIDVDEQRHGGAYGFTQIDEDGSEYAFRGVYHGEPSPELTMRTFEWLGMPGHVSFETMRMTALDGDRTRVSVTSVFQSTADRDGMAASGMETGVEEGYAQLDELLAELRTQQPVG